MYEEINQSVSVSVTDAREAGEVAAHGFAPHAEWGGMGEHEHFVQFYEDDLFLIDSLSGFIGTGLGAGDTCIVVAGRERRESLENRLRAEGLDLAAAGERGHYVSLDAADTLSLIMDGEMPEPSRFAEVVGGLVARREGEPRRVRVFGEMVALLCGEGRHTAAVRLESLWNELQKSHPFSLFCAYPLHGFGRESLAQQLGDVCAEHSRVIPAEGYTSLKADDQRHREIILLQQKARALEAEVAERRAVELSLRAVKEELELLLAREQTARAEAEVANRLKDEFLATVSHELRTPLTAIVGWSDMLRRGMVKDADLAHAFDTIERNARAQTQLVDDMLDVSRIITGKLQLEVRSVDPVALVDSAIESVRLAAEAKGINIRKLIDAGLMWVAGDAARLQQVVWNLLTNAIKFTPGGGIVTVRLGRVGSHVEITVADTGLGIAQEFLPYVFERFRQADGTTSRRFGGLGLGLSIVRHLVELHGGAVRADSGGEGEGATFTVSLPLAPNAREGAKGGVAHASAPALASLRLDSPESLEGVRILLVDDEADTRELVRVALEHCGAAVSTARSVAEALELLELAGPDVLVGDIGMPGEDGYDLIRKVRQLPGERGGAVRAVALTAYARAEDRMRALREGFDTHVAKPMEIAELVAVIAGLVKR